MPRFPVPKLHGGSPEVGPNSGQTKTVLKRNLSLRLSPLHSDSREIRVPTRLCFSEPAVDLGRVV